MARDGAQRGAVTVTRGGVLSYALPEQIGESDWSLDPKQFRYWIALHEVTHHLQFSHPWVENYFRSQITTLIDSLVRS